ncbi:MAG TPA: hypothetical protein VGV12_14410 [Gemmatimonadales bacterium]|nr:hypothetical protein [Gemmatimonadales bacterium]
MTSPARGIAVVCVLWLGLARPRAAVAQTARDLVSQGVRAYRALEYDAAVALLKRSLTEGAVGTLSTAERAQALTYLGATELFRGRRDSAALAFGNVVVLDPRYQPDELIFPPQVTNLFQEVRQATKTVALTVPPVTELRAKGDRFTARVFTSSLADVAVTLARDDGTPVRELYTGPVADSLSVTWDGFSAGGTPVATGRYVLRVAPRTEGAAGPPARQVPLDIEQRALDTLPWPPAPTSPAFLPERTPAGPAVRSLAAGVVAAAAAIALPSLVARGSRGSDARFAVGAAIGAAGVVGFIAQRPRPLAANVRANAPQRDAWTRRLEAVKDSNATRRATVRLVIRAGPLATAERGGTSP